jgi:hypothetical protein
MNKRTPPTTAAKTPPVMPFCWSLMSPVYTAGHTAGGAGIWPLWRTSR